MKSTIGEMNEATEQPITPTSLGRVKRLVSWFGTNTSKTFCIGYFVWWFILAVMAIGEMSQPKVYTWYFPILVMGFLLPPCFFAYLAGREDACKKDIEQMDSLGS